MRLLADGHAPVQGVRRRRRAEGASRGLPVLAVLAAARFASSNLLTPIGPLIEPTTYQKPHPYAFRHHPYPLQNSPHGTRPTLCETVQARRLHQHVFLLSVDLGRRV